LTGWISGFDIRQKQAFFSQPSRQDRPCLIYAPVEWVRGSMGKKVKRPGREVSHLSPSVAEFRNMYSYTSLPHKISWYCALLKKEKTRMTFPFYHIPLQNLNGHEKATHHKALFVRDGMTSEIFMEASLVGCDTL
jgi:hypothetical protein